MSNESSVRDVRALWQTQPGEGGNMSVADVQRKSQQLQEKARRRAMAFYVMGAMNGGLPLLLMWFLPELRWGLGYLAITAVFLVAFVQRRSAFRLMPANMTAAQGLAFYRRLLERERDFRTESTWWFTVGPGLNIIVLTLVYTMSPLFHRTPMELSIVAMTLVTHVIVLTRVAQKLRGEARTYQIALDGLTDPLAQS
jgi:hypothetical protein